MTNQVRNALNLTPRQEKVVAAYARGGQAATIAVGLGIAKGTVEALADNAKRSMGVRTMAQATAIWAAYEAEKLLTQFYESKGVEKDGG